jgi:hypothetical protein
LHQLNKTGEFNVNWRLIDDPIVQNHHAIDFNLLFDVGSHQKGCKRPYRNITSTQSFDERFDDRFV